MNKEKQPEGNYYNKFDSQNPIERRLMTNFYKALYLCIDKVLEKSGGGKPIDVLEAGCGEGRITELVHQYLKERGYTVNFEAFDISDDVVRQAARNDLDVVFYVDDIYCIHSEKKYDLLICSEVCEHLEAPQRAIEELKRVSSDLIISVPNEPIWRILNMVRGKYIRRLGNTPGHIQHWSKRKFISMLRKECGLEPVLVKTPLPWIMVYCRKS